MILSLQSKKPEKKVFDNHKLTQLKSENVVIKQVNSLLSKRLADMEIQC